MRVDYLILGQGLCGTWLSYYLLQAGASILLIDRGTGNSASAAASGIINPVTGKRLARQWMGDIIQPFAFNAYEAMSQVLQTPLASTIPIHNFFSNDEEASFFGKKAETSHEDLLSMNAAFDGAEAFNYHYGSGTIYPAMLINAGALLKGWRAELSLNEAMLEEEFDWGACQLMNNTVQYKDIEAKALIDCSGASSTANPYFYRLPFALNKGEAIIAAIPGLPREAIYKFANLSIVPWVGDKFWIGSTFDWDFADELPTSSFRQKVESILRGWLKLSYELGPHFAAIRPATVTRDAFAGMHPLHPQIGILNGMGSKGCSLAPFLAHNLSEHLVHGSALIPQVDVQRYARALSR